MALPGYDIDKNVFCSEEEYFFEIAEAVFVGWFSFEYVVRFDISSKLLNITIFIQIQSMPDNSNQPIEIMTFPPGSSRLHTSQSKWKRKINDIDVNAEGHFLKVQILLE